MHRPGTWVNPSRAALAAVHWLCSAVPMTQPEKLSPRSRPLWGAGVTAIADWADNHRSR
ncbi:hypothetical protein GCM10010112_65590 [Actinoplanes lobatus]|uniref:Uncharacterized protein n=1 Tax=Actinoplanes lobatus TaxID=113568 RepID=A0ABQ4ATG7_9ACTN|nr:hypothetical protein GCM10010112_65590 [Actinoplanes lobatus]GIE44308.1 hypothetical protein Alo02nite_72060 [Actinoplanes lobatus]